MKLARYSWKSEYKYTYKVNEINPSVDMQRVEYDMHPWCLSDYFNCRNVKEKKNAYVS